jgi:hypothetical protein
VGVGGVVQSDGPRPPLRQHGGSTLGLVSSETSGRSRDAASSSGEVRTPHRGGSDGVSCARGDRSSSSGEISDRSVV